MERFVNNFKTAMFLAAIMALCMVAFSYIAPAFGFSTGTGVIFGLMFGGLGNIIAFFFSDKIALGSMRAQQVDRQQAPQLVGMVEELAGKAGLPTPRVYISPQQAPNAFATGRSPRHGVVCVTQGLLQAMNRDELAGVIAHELAHIKHRDVLISTVAATIAGAISALGYLFWFIPIGGGDRENGNPLAALAMLILAPIAAGLIQLAISRTREFSADNHAAELAGSRGLISALQKLESYNQRIPMQAPQSHSNMFIVEPLLGRKQFASLFSTHPSVEQRVEKLRASGY